MVFEPRVAGWKVQMNPLSYGSTPVNFITYFYRKFRKLYLFVLPELYFTSLNDSWTAYTNFFLNSDYGCRYSCCSNVLEASGSIPTNEFVF